MADLQRIAQILQDAAETHHTVYAITQGEDPDWASWYADWLLTLSDLPKMLGTTPVRSELVWLLVQADKDGAADAEGKWQPAYAQRLVDRFGSA
jgi:hypothetical protein